LKLKKAEDELSIFLSFALAASLQLDTESIEQNSPPSPDIVCRIGGVSTAYELTAATNEPLHALLAQHGIAAGWIGTGHGQYGEISAPNEVVAAFRKKLTKKYEFDGPVELVIHEGLADLCPTELWMPDFLGEMRSRIATSQFRRAWVVRHDGKEIYAVWPPTST
jgi:hypothetical protein